MAGETAIDKLLSGMSPHLNAGEYVFCTLKGGHPALDLDPIGSFREAEGLTLILERNAAQHAGLTYDYVAAWITLNIHSSLQAVGLTAAFATALKEAGISCNVVAAYYHDHIFVAQSDAGRAMEVLWALAGGQGGQ